MQNIQIQKISLVLALNCFFVVSPASAEPVLGECGRYMGNRQASCKNGTFHHNPRHTNTEFRWSCRNIPYDGEEICTESKVLTEFAECGEVYWGPYDASCKKGEHHPHPGHTAEEFRWTCRNIPHNGEVRCSLPRPKIKKEKEKEEEEGEQLSEDAPETEEDSASPTEEEASVLQTTLLVTLSNDYKARSSLDLMVVTNDQNHIVSIEAKKESENQTKTYSPEKLKVKIPLLREAGITLVDLQLFSFKPEHGGVLQIEYPYNVFKGSYRQFRAELKHQDGKWGLYQDGRRFQGIHLVINRWWGLPIGIKEVQLR